MPGAFHSELKAQGKRAVRIWLLDMEWKNPVVANSQVEARLARPGTRLRDIPLECAVQTDFFECKLPDHARFQKGDQLILKSSREGQPSAEVRYEFPFKLQGH